MNSTGSLKCRITGNADGSFTAAGSIDMNDLKIITPDFEPAVICGVYRKAINSFTALNVDFSAGYTAADGMSITLGTDASDRFVPIFRNLLDSEMTEITAAAKEQVAAMLSEKTSGVDGEIAQFAGIRDALKLQQENIADVDEQLNSVKKTVMTRLMKQTGENASQQIMRAVDTDKVRNGLKGLLGQ
jgi:hypothetical protein